MSVSLQVKVNINILISNKTGTDYIIGNNLNRLFRSSDLKFIGLLYNNNPPPSNYEESSSIIRYSEVWSRSKC